MKEGIFAGLFLVALGLYLLKRGAIGGVVPFTREERPFLFFFTICFAIGGGLFVAISALFK